MTSHRICLPHTATMRANYYGDAALAALRGLGDVVVNPSEQALDAAALIELARGCSVIVSDRQTAGDAEVFAQSPELIAFVRCAVDIRTIDVAAASRHGVLVTQASPGFVAAVTELTIGFVIDLARGVSRVSAQFHAGQIPAARMGRQLAGSTIGIIGYGAIGRAIGDAALALQMTVMVADPHARVVNPRITQCPLDALLAGADFVVCAAVANPATENLLNDAAFARMRHGAYFINIARGNLVDEAALLRALDSGRLAGCALDVGRAPDQMPSPRLAARADVIATPHIGGLTPDAIAHQAMETVTQVGAILAGTLPPGAVNGPQAARFERFARAKEQ